MKKVLIGLSKFLVFLVVALLVSAYTLLNLSQPTLDGEISANLDAPATVHRDKQGIPTLFAQNREDLSLVLGYLHAQERFFQMDLLRRNSAGELSELFGQKALEYDKNIRLHQFRKRAEKYLFNLSDSQRAVLNAYTAGVNQGLKDLSSRPFEYWLLNKHPANWRPADSLLVLYSMYLDLQYENGDRERALGQLRDNLMPDVYAFLTPAGSKWDAALDGSEYQPSPMPRSNFDLAPVLAQMNAPYSDDFKLFDESQEALVGSNNWAVGGDVSQTGSAIVADDMHLGLRVPNIWYRASFRYNQDKQKIRVDGVTLPGTPAMVVGSNHNVAWGFTNSYGDWNDVITLGVNESGSHYLTPDGYKPFETESEVILISDQMAFEHEIKKTIWGPVIGRDHNGNLLALRWVAHDAEGINFNLLDMEQAQDVYQAIDVANRSGVPAQNLVAGDSQGNIAWTIAGAIPKKFGKSNSNAHGWAVPQDWSKGKLGWSGYLEKDQYPKIVNPKDHRIWTANSRVVGNQALEIVGNGGYALGARSQQIRDDLYSLDHFSEQDLLDIQNDDRAVFLSPWRDFLLDNVLQYDFIQEESLTELVTYLQNWQGRAHTDSVGYHFVRQFRLNARDAIFNPLAQNINDTASVAGKEFKLHPIRHQLEVPMWQMINDQPQHLVPKGFNNWQSFLQQMVRETVNQLETEYGSLAKATWGARNTATIQHPLSKAVPALSWLLDMPKQAANGDSYMPRVQGVAFGASQRMVVSPGFEEDAIFHMPTSQSGHPLSPYYGMGHQDWLEGRPSPLLPGKTQYKLSFFTN